MPLKRFECKVPSINAYHFYQFDITLFATHDDNENQHSLTFAANDENHLPIMRLLIQNDATIDAKDNDGRTSLFTASDMGNKDSVNLLLEYNQGIESINISDKNGNTPLLVASENGYTEIMRSLIEHKAGIDNPNVIGCTPLHIVG